MGTISYGNYHFLVVKLPDISFLEIYITDIPIFDEKLGHINTQNNTTISVFSNFFYTKIIYLSNNIALTRYVNSTHGNWDNYNQNNNIMSNTTNNDGPKSEPKDLN